MVRRMQESNDNIFYCAECTYDKSNGTMFLYTTDIIEVRGSIKPKDSMNVEGGFLVRRKYFRSEYEAQEYIDSLPNAMPMSRNESFRISESNISEEILTDDQIKLMLSYLIHYGISDGGLQQVIRATINDKTSDINWQKVLNNIYKYMPEIKKYDTFDDFEAEMRMKLV